MWNLICAIFKTLSEKYTSRDRKGEIKLCGQRMAAQNIILYITLKSTITIGSKTYMYVANGQVTHYETDQPSTLWLAD